MGYSKFKGLEGKKRMGVRVTERSSFTRVRNLNTSQDGGGRTIELKDADIWTEEESIWV